MFERLGQLLDQLSLDGLRRWALLGVQGHTHDVAAQAAWFRLESQDARTILCARARARCSAMWSAGWGFTCVRCGRANRSFVPPARHGKGRG
jgi:hypothetical protein